MRRTTVSAPRPVSYIGQTKREPGAEPAQTVSWEGRMRTAIFALAFAMGAGLTFDDATAQAGFPPPPPKVSPAAGVVDMHIHSHPDVFGRNLDDIDVAQIAKSRGM